MSTVATAAISAFPMNFLKNDTNLQREITRSMSGFQAQRIYINPNVTDFTNATIVKEEP